MAPTTQFTHQPLRTDYSGTDMPFVRCNNGGYRIFATSLICALGTRPKASGRILAVTVLFP